MDRFIHPDARVLVCDGRKALFLRNSGAAGKTTLTVEREIHTKTPSHTAEMGTDKPGSVGQMVGGARSSVEGTDWHSAEEDEFLRRVVLEFDEACEASAAREVVLVAPPRALATLRKAAPRRLIEKVVAEIDKDLTKHPVEDIARILNA